MVLRQVFASVLLGLAACLSFVQPASAEKRVALVLGNSAYVHAPALLKPTNDARAIADLLTRIGFDDVALRLDLDFNGMRLALHDFGLSARNAEVAVVYFAGHGLELAGENFLVPVDATFNSASNVTIEATTLNAVLDATRPASKLRLVILDACRVSPLAARLEMAGSLTRSVQRGLARIEPTLGGIKPMGEVLVAYAAKAGTVAEDGKGQHSPYTEALLSTLATPGLDIRLIMGRVRDLVLAKTAGTQEPFVYGSLGGANVTLVSLKTSDPIEAAHTDAKTARDYELAAKVGTKEAWDTFLAGHPTGFHAELARVQRAKLTALAPTALPRLEKPTGAPFDGLRKLDFAAFNSACTHRDQRNMFWRIRQGVVDGQGFKGPARGSVSNGGQLKATWAATYIPGQTVELIATLKGDRGAGTFNGARGCAASVKFTRV